MFAVEGAVAGTGVPSRFCEVDVVVSFGDGSECRCAVSREAVEEGVEMSAAPGERLVAAGDERSPERGDGAGAGGGEGTACDEKLAAVTRVGGAGEIGNSAAWLAGGAEGDVGVLLP